MTLTTSLVLKSLPNDYQWVLLSAASIPILTTWQAFVVVGGLRKRAKIRYPATFATPEQEKASKEALQFNCAQRAHMNTLENLPAAYFTLLFSGFEYPRLAAALGGLFVVGRVLYTLGYATGQPAKRQLGAFGSLALLGLVGTSLTTAVRLVLDRL